MAIRYAIKNGNWSDPTVWDGATTLPASADDVRSNTFTVTIDGDYTVRSLSNRVETSPVVAVGGAFVPINGITLTCTLVGSGIFPGITNNVPFDSYLTAGQSCTVVADVIGGAASGSWALRNSSGGTINIAGSVFGGSGNINSHGVINSSSGTINIIGNVFTDVSTINAGYAINNAGSGTINLTGNATARTASTSAIINSSLGVVNMTGNAIGGNGIGNTLVNNSSGTISQIGTVQAGALSPAIGPGSTSQLTFLTGPFIGHPNSTQANIAAAWRWNLANPATYIEVYSSDLLDTTPRTLYTADFVGGNPSVADVRAGTTFGPAAELTGTMVVPAPEFVEGGVEVDDTVGTAITTGAEVWNAPMGLVSGAVGTVGERLKNTATIQSVGAQIEALGA